MPNPASAIPLEYDGNDLQEADFSIFLEIVEGLDESADHRGVDTVVPGLDGQIEGNRRPDRRSILLAGIVRGTGGTPMADLRDNIQTLSGWFDPASPADLVATLENGDTATIRARTTPGFPKWRKENRVLARVVIELVSIDPEWVIT